MDQSEADADADSARQGGRTGRLAMDQGQFVGMSVGQSVGRWECIMGALRH